MLSETNRATLPAWYQEALELEFQIHIRVAGPSINTHFFQRSTNTWSDAPPLTEEIFTDLEQIPLFGNQLIKHVRSLKGTSVGVVIHIADEFSTAELKHELDNPGALSDLRQQAYDSPGGILDDSSVPPDQASWRVLPYPAAKSEAIATTVSTSRRLGPFADALRNLGGEQNFPVVIHSLSAPLVALMGLPNAIDIKHDRPFVAILQYPWFTAMAFFNEHADLRLLRTLQHRGLRRPSNFRHALSTTNASLEFVDPDIYVLPLGSEADEKLVEDLQKSFPESKVEFTKFPKTGPLPEWMPEPALCLEETGEETEGMSHTFGVLRSERWFLQDFLPANREVSELYPTRSEMRLLSVLKLGRVALFAIAVLCFAWLAFSIFSMVRRPEWAFNDNDARSVKQRVLMLTQERQRMDHFANLLDDRSKAWTAMETLARLFPAKSGLLVTGFSHTVRPDNAPGQSKIGFIKEWKINGMARDEALDYLNKLNTREGISSHFSEITQVTGNTAYDPTPTTRSIVINVKTQENGSFTQMPLEQVNDSDEATYPFSFIMTITQRFESADEMAINAGKAP